MAPDQPEEHRVQRRLHRAGRAVAQARAADVESIRRGGEGVKVSSKTQAPSSKFQRRRRIKFTRRANEAQRAIGARNLELLWNLQDLVRPILGIVLCHAQNEQRDLQF